MHANTTMKMKRGNRLILNQNGSTIIYVYYADGLRRSRTTGEVIDKDAPGNINYGYFGASLGIMDVVLYGGAGYAQIMAGTSSAEYLYGYFDDLRDTQRIKQGIQLYYNDPWMQYPQPGSTPK